MSPADPDDCACDNKMIVTEHANEDEARAALHQEGDAVEVAALYITCSVCGYQSLIDHEACRVDPVHDLQHCPECDHVYDASTARIWAHIERQQEGGT